MPRYIAFRTKYLEKIVSEDGKECPIDEVLGYRVVLVRCWWNGKDYFFHQYTDISKLPKATRDVMEDAMIDIPFGSIVFEKTNGKDVGSRDVKLYDYLVDAKYCCIYNLEEALEYDNCIVVKCSSKSK